MNNRAERLRAYWEQWRGSRFVFGRADCAWFVARWLDRELHAEPTFESRMRTDFTYTTKLGALRTLENGGGYEAIVTRYLGEPREEWELPAVGDVALFENLDGAETLGVMCGAVIVAPAQEGVAAVGAERLLACWALDAVGQQ